LQKPKMFVGGSWGGKGEGTGEAAAPPAGYAHALLDTNTNKQFQTAVSPIQLHQFACVINHLNVYWLKCNVHLSKLILTFLAVFGTIEVEVVDGMHCF